MSAETFPIYRKRYFSQSLTEFNLELIFNCCFRLYIYIYAFYDIIILSHATSFVYTMPNHDKRE